MTQLLRLDDPRCLRPDLAGAKAAGLAAARRHGLPVLDGVVVPADAATSALRRGAAALSVRGSGGARLTVTSRGPDRDLRPALRRAVDELGPPVIARSSADVERDGRWSGAFGSLPDIAADDIDKAVSSCWASVFRPDTLDRLKAEDMTPETLRFAVLIQPQLHPLGGGTARLTQDSTAEVTATTGPLAGLLTGWETGTRAARQPDGSTVGDMTLGGLGRTVLDAVDELLRAVADRIGDRAIEWAWTGERVVLLQTMPGHTAAKQTPTSVAAHVAPALDVPFALKVARTVHRYGVPPADELVLPWAIGQEDPSWPGGATLDAAAARSMADELIAIAWREPPARARQTAREVLSQLRGSRPGPALERLAELEDVPEQHAADLVATSIHLRAQVRTRQGPRRWEPFLYGVVSQHGSDADGTAAAPGVGAGTVSVLTDPHDPSAVAPRSILVSPAPVPALAPRLWRAAGLVTTSGSPGAHLFEVARSLGVPAVIVPDLLEQISHAGTSDVLIMAVDGTRGLVSWVPSRPVAMVAGRVR